LRAIAQKKERTSGQSLVETMSAFFILIPVGLVAIDIVCLVSSTQQNEQVAEMAARAAATQFSQDKAENAAKEAIAQVQPSPVIVSVTMENLTYDPVQGNVSVSTIMDVRLPIPFPFFSQVNCRASSVQPIVSIPAPG
jgi:Flp pilus assembly protein TadG